MTQAMLVTGGSRGLGAAVAINAAQSGWDVCINYSRNEARAAHVVKEITALGRRALAIRADVAQEAEVMERFRTIDEKFGPLGALVNSAGLSTPQDARAS